MFERVTDFDWPGALLAGAIGVALGVLLGGGATIWTLLAA